MGGAQEAGGGSVGCALYAVFSIRALLDLRAHWGTQDLGVPQDLLEQL